MSARSWGNFSRLTGFSSARKSVLGQRMRGSEHVDKPQVKQPIGPTTLVCLATTDNLESSVSVESGSRDVLLVDVNLSDTVICDRVAEKHRADSTSTLRCVDGKHFQVSVENTGESHRLAIKLCNREGDCREVVRLKVALYLIAVTIREEIVRRIHGAARDRNECGIAELYAVVAC